MTEVIRISKEIFLVKEIIDSKTTIFISYNMENSTKSFSPTKKDWEEASKNFPIENLELIPELLYAWKCIEKKILEDETEMANWDFSGHI